MEATLRSHGIANGVVVLAGLSNSYSHYIATPEEYMLQRYEAASTLYGRATLGIYLQEFTRLMNNLLAGLSVPPGPPPPNLNQTVRITQYYTDTDADRDRGTCTYIHIDTHTCTHTHRSIPARLTVPHAQYTFFAPVIMDRVPDGHHFGDVVQDVAGAYSPGDIASAVFYGANPRNNLHTQDSFLFVERLDGGNWTTVAVDVRAAMSFMGVF